MTDRENDVNIAYSLIGKTNEFFKPIWSELGTGWDGAPCTEIACCISYMAGNLSKIPVSNYAAGLYKKFKNEGLTGDVPEVGAFIFFGYGTEPDHTGRIVEVRANEIVTIEGNVNNKVVCRTYRFDDAYIFSYGYPRYDVNPRADFLLAAPRDIVIKRGDYDFSVFWLQMHLKRKGYYTGTLDGDFGTYTETALKKYQSENKLVADGVAGWYTLTKILNS